MSRERLYRRVRESLKDVYGDRLEGVIVYGSAVRRRLRRDSDIDLLVLLKGQIDLGEELRTVTTTLYQLQLDILRPIHAIPVEAEKYRAGEFSLYRNAKKEGLAI